MNILSSLKNYILPSPPREGLGVGLHAFALIREDKLFSAIYVAGTAVAIASAMVIAIVFNMLLADIPPEVNRSRTLYVYNRFIPGEKSDDVPYHQGLSSVALDSCYRRMACVEAATGIIPAYQNSYTIEGEAQLRQGQYEAPRVFSAIATDHDFFRIYDLDFIDGRPFSKKESDEGEHVCVVTDMVAARTGTSTGGTVRVNGKPFRVVGVVNAVSAFLEESTADIYVPYLVEGMNLYPNNRNPLRNGDNYVDVTYDGNLDARIMLREGFTLKDFDAELEPLRQQYSAVISSQLGEKVEWAVNARTHFFNKIHFFRPDGADDQGLALQAKNLMPPAILMLLFLFLPAINLSGLVSNRMEARRAEMGIRKAFGAKRRTLLRHRRLGAVGTLRGCHSQQSGIPGDIRLCRPKRGEHGYAVPNVLHTDALHHRLPLLCAAQPYGRPAARLALAAQTHRRIVEPEKITPS